MFASTTVLSPLMKSARSPKEAQLRRRLWDGIVSLGGVHLNGDRERRVAGILIKETGSGATVGRFRLSPSYQPLALHHLPAGGSG